MSKFNVMLDVEIEPTSSDNLTLGSLIELCHMHSINMSAPIKIFMPDSSISYWVNHTWVIDDKSQITMLGRTDESPDKWTPLMLTKIKAASSFKLVDAKHRRVMLLGWSRDSITLESHV